jgi:two-component system, OmpR family, response regulator
VSLAGKRLLVVGQDEPLFRQVSEAGAARGVTVTASELGREAIALIGAGEADALLVDLPLGDIRGDVFLMALRERGLPCVVVSGVLRGPRFAALARQFGALGYLEKPCSAEEALDILEEALAPAAPSPQPSPLAGDKPPFPPQGEREEATATATPIPIPTPIDDPTDLDSLIYSQTRPALDETLPGLPLTPRAAQGFELPLPTMTPAPAARRIGEPALPDGDLAVTSVPRLLATLGAARVTGALTLARGEVKKLVLLEAGHTVLATSNVAAERFGARAVTAGILSAEALAALKRELGADAPIGEALVARGLLEPAARARMVRDQVCEVVWSAFGWREGTYRLLVSPLSRRARVSLDLAPGDLVLEGVRRTAGLEWLREELPARLALAPRANPSVPPSDLHLTPGEATMLAHADGTKTVGDLVALSHLPERDALAFLHGCRELGLLDAVKRGLAGTRRIGFM